MAVDHEQFDPAQWRPWQAYWTSTFGKVSHPDWNPYAWGLIEIKRGEPWPMAPTVVDPSKLPPEFNVYGLYWRPWPVVHPVFDGP